MTTERQTKVKMIPSSISGPNPDKIDFVTWELITTDDGTIYGVNKFWSNN